MLLVHTWESVFLCRSMYLSTSINLSFCCCVFTLGMMCIHIPLCIYVCICSYVYVCVFIVLSPCSCVSLKVRICIVIRDSHLTNNSWEQRKADTNQKLPTPSVTLVSLSSVLIKFSLTFFRQNFFIATLYMIQFIFILSTMTTTGEVIRVIVGEKIFYN